MLQLVWSHPNRQRRLIRNFSIKKTFEIEDEKRYRVKRALDANVFSILPDEQDFELYRRG